MTIELRTDAVIGGCRVERLIGRGGMGLVYLAEQIGLGRRVALKVIAPELSQDIGFRQRFEREARMAASLEHPHTVTVYGAGEDDDRLYLVMRYIGGRDLRQVLIADGALAPEQAVEVMTQVAGALDDAHHHGLVHRDVKPANILIADSEEIVAFLSDFGLTKHASSLSGLTQTGNWVGTADYVAPEQIQGEPVDARTDVYALGCVMHEALTGDVPYPRDTDMAKMWAHVNAPPPRPSEQRTGLPSEFDQVVQRALAKRPADRFPSAGDLARAARAALERRPATAPERSVATGPAAPIAENGPTDTRAIPPPPGTGRTQLEPVYGPPTQATAPGPPPPLPSKRPTPRWIPVAIGIAVVFVLGGAAAALVATGGQSGGGAGERAGPAPATTVTVKPTISPPPPKSTEGRKPPGKTTTYRGADYTFDYPADWSVTEDEVSKGAFSRTSLVSSDGGQTVVIDHTPGETTDPATKARQLRGDGSTTTTFEPVTLGGRPGFQWAFRDNGQQKVDYLLNTGSDGYAVLGESDPSNFSVVSKVAYQIANSLAPT